MSDEILNKLAKSQEGVMLGLGAVAEVLQKMDARLEKSEVVEMQKQMEMVEHVELQKAMEERDALVKDTATMVVKLLKEAGLGMPTDGRTPVVVAGKDMWPMDRRPAAEDEEEPVNVRTATEEVQKPIQAMRVQKAEDKKDKDEDEKYNKGAKEYPMEEDEEKDTPVKKMMAQFAELQKKYTALEKGIETRIQEETESRLRKMGFREERSLAPTRSRSLGVDDVPLRKSAEATPEDIVDQLVKLPYKQLRELQFLREIGQTDGLPKELLQN